MTQIQYFQSYYFFIFLLVGTMLETVSVKLIRNNLLEILLNLRSS